MCVITIIYASFTTLRQCDFKVIVAYSSVAHMSSILIGLFSNTVIGIEGAILLSLAHGF
ncbi:NADH dehydrogenase subunit 4, partial (mitochondrion) [Neolecta irregularis DAH-3]